MITITREEKVKTNSDILLARMDNQESVMQVLEQEILKIRMIQMDIPEEGEIKERMIINLVELFFGINQKINYELPY